ncbi:MAG: 2-dehydro-3-deoxygalactonokinase, partial [Pseudomonadota bacterium]
GALLHKLFAARTLPLFERLTPVEASNYLSGLLIGSEVAAGLAQSPSSAATTVIGQDTLAARYVKVLSLAGIQAHRAEQAMVARGHWEIATMAELTT